jgi:hypothetical protein
MWSPTCLPRKQADLIVSLAITAIIAWMVWDARGWDARARLFPVAIGIPALCVALLQLGLSVRALRRVDLAKVSVGGGSLEADPKLSQRTRQMIAWIVAMTAGMVLLGFEVGSALLTFAFLRFAARERVWLSLTLAVMTFLFFYLVFDRGLNIPFPPGLLTGWK